jgi:hemerythrin superfamily protein
MAKSKVKSKVKMSSAKKVSTNKEKSIKADSSQDIIKLILVDHKPLKSFIKILKNSDKDLNVRRKALEEFAPLLINHAQSEERALYSFMERDKELREESFEGEVEHELAELMLESISVEKNEDMWSAKVKVLAELVDHHITEEEDEVLPDVRKVTSSEQRLDMGAKYLDFKLQFDFPMEVTEEMRDVTALELLELPNLLL